MSKQIIGGEFAIDSKIIVENNDRECPSIYANGRSALRGIIQHMMPISSILIPDYICGSVPLTLKSMGIKCIFYHVNDDFLPDISSVMEKINKVQVIILINYFGMISSISMRNIIEQMKNQGSNIKVIVDDVQNYYGLEEEVNCDYAFTSYRKWFPVPDGADAVWNHNGKQELLYPDEKIAVPSAFSKYKFAGNVLKNYREIIGDDICLELLGKGEQIISTTETEVALSWSKDAMKKMDFSRIQLIRKENAKILHEGLLELGVQHLYDDNATPLFVPIIIKGNRNRVRSAFFKENIFCPIHWGEDWKMEFKGVEHNELSSYELSLICDQRYGIEEMKQQLEILRDESNYFEPME